MPEKPRSAKIFEYGCLGCVGGGILLVITFLIFMKLAFGPLSESIEIQQDIGGKLICQSEYTADLSAWFYDVDYIYETANGTLLNVGKGSIYKREWHKNDQLVKMGDWLILNTGAGFSSDQLLIGNSTQNDWRSFIFSPDEIQNDNLWDQKGIQVGPNWEPISAFFVKFDEKKVQVEYSYGIRGAEYRIEKRLITYDFSVDVGEPQMVGIDLVE